MTVLKERGLLIRKYKKLLATYENDEIITEKFKALCYGYSGLGKLLKDQMDEELAKRIDELETKLEG